MGVNVTEEDVNGNLSKAVSVKQFLTPHAGTEKDLKVQKGETGRHCVLRLIPISVLSQSLCGSPLYSPAEMVFEYCL